ncbi:hypothetical protein BHM03_00000084 [Ensete ventricosum]|uniref:Uncharacterized protein n=1 Tax=Ensete ventricosum TaxID=4639 RepID=A0A445M8A5_ENSVE|nr:hypothetical protein BHM03_00000084 [Ensete ventricosum]
MAVRRIDGRGTFESDNSNEGSSSKRGGSGDEEEEIKAAIKEGLAVVEVAEKQRRWQRGPTRAAAEGRKGRGGRGGG